MLILCQQLCEAVLWHGSSVEIHYHFTTRSCNIMKFLDPICYLQQRCRWNNKSLKMKVFSKEKGVSKPQKISCSVGSRYFGISCQMTPVTSLMLCKWVCPIEPSCLVGAHNKPVYDVCNQNAFYLKLGTEMLLSQVYSTLTG